MKYPSFFFASGKRTAAPIKAQAAKKPRRSVTKKSPKKRSKPKPVVNDDTSEDEEEEVRNQMEKIIVCPVTEYGTWFVFLAACFGRRRE